MPGRAAFLVWRGMREAIMFVKEYGVPKEPRFAKNDRSEGNKQLRIQITFI